MGYIAKSLHGQVEVLSARLTISSVYNDGSFYLLQVTFDCRGLTGSQIGSPLCPPKRMPYEQAWNRHR